MANTVVPSHETDGALRDEIAVIAPVMSGAEPSATTVPMLAGHNSIEIGERLDRSDRGVRQAYFRGRRIFETVAARRGVETTCH